MEVALPLDEAVLEIGFAVLKPKLSAVVLAPFFFFFFLFCFVLDDNDMFVSLPAGYGKSILYDIFTFCSLFLAMAASKNSSALWHPFFRYTHIYLCCVQLCRVQLCRVQLCHVQLCCVQLCSVCDGLIQTC